MLGAATDDSVFLDVTSIKPGELWDEKITDALQTAEVFILYWCCQSAESEYIAAEIGSALKDPNKRLVPVLLCSAALPSELSKRQWIDLRKKVVHDCVT